MLDLEKAFDLVWHRCLIYKMRRMGLNGNILNFVADFLSNRSIRVSIVAAVSTVKFVYAAKWNTSGQCHQSVTLPADGQRHR